MSSMILEFGQVVAKLVQALSIIQFWGLKIKQRLMQGHQAYQHSYHSQPMTIPNANTKYSSPLHHKQFDKTLPVHGIKHVPSNPNISMEFSHSKSSNHATESGGDVGSKKNFQFRMTPTHLHNGYNQHLLPPRAARGEMCKSLIVPESNSIEIPEQPGTKRELFKNIPKRQYRMSETIEDMHGGMYNKQEEPSVTITKESVTLTKESNFYKKDSKDNVEERLEVPKQIPSFLSRNDGRGEMKRSQVVAPTFQPPRVPTRQFARLSIPRVRKLKVDDFTRLKELGNGKYGRVYLVVEKLSGFICALKVIEKKLLHEQEITDQFIREVKIQMFLNHPNIIKMYGCFDDVANIYIILEVGTGGQLYHQLKKSQPLPEPRIALIMRQVCEAVNEIHSLRIIHRDIKPENIVMHDNIIKLCDFGWSVHQDNKLRTTFCGTPLYVCPQILKGREYDQKIDIWSIGIMMYQMVVGENPFKITREQELIKIVKDQIKIPSYLFVSAEVRDFLDRCLQKNPGDRASIKELMTHAFIKKHQDKNQKKMINM